MSEPTLEELREVATLARIDLSDAELLGLAGDVRELLQYMSKISEVNVDNVQPMTHGVVLVNVFGDDVPVPSLSLEDALANAPETEGGFFKVPA